MLYLVMAVVGFAIPISLIPSTLEQGNLLLMQNPEATINLLFGNYVSAAFGLDLLWVFVVFCTWVLMDSRKQGVKHGWLFLVLALLFGVSGPFPLYLYFREQKLRAKTE